MEFLERLSDWLGIKPKTPESSAQPSSKEALDKAKFYKRTGELSLALAELDRALVILSQRDVVLRAAVDLHRADIFIAQGRLAEADTLLARLQQDAETHRQPAQLAYVLTAQGLLAQTRNDWETARDFYERSFDPAKESRSLGAEGRAQGHLAETYLREGNASYAAHLLEEALPKLDKSGDTELVSYFIGLLGKAKIELGRVDQGQHLIERALRLAEQMQYVRYALLWRRELGARALEAGHYDLAKRHLGLVLSRTDGQSLPLERLVTLRWMSKVCLRLGEITDSVNYAIDAVMLASQQGKDSDAYKLSQGALGIAFKSAGRYDEAVAALEAAADGYVQDELAPAEYTYGDILRTLAAVQLEKDHYPIAYATYERAQKYAESQESQIELAAVYHDLGILYSRQGTLEEAVQAWATAAQHYETLSDSAKASRLNCDIAGVRKHLGQGIQAMRSYNKALTLLNSVKDQVTRGVVLANAATAYLDQGDVESAESFLLEAIQIAEFTQDHEAEAIRRGNFGWLLLVTGRPQRALETLKETVLKSEHLGLELQRIVQTNNIGRVYAQLGDTNIAMDYHQHAQTALLKMDSSRQWMGVVQADMAHTLMALDRFDEAVPLLDAALEAGRETRFAELIIHAMNGQIRLSLLRDAVAQAKEPLEEAFRLARQSGNVRLQADTMALRSEYYARTGHPQQAEAEWEQVVKRRTILDKSADNSPPAWLRA